MQKNSTPPTVAAFLAAHGGSSLAVHDAANLASLVSLFRDAAPSPDFDPLSQENLTFLTAIIDCLEVMDERVYEHYRALIDLFRDGVFRADRKKLLAYPSWNTLREKGVRLGILPADLYGHSRPHPHVGLSDVYSVLKGGVRV